MAYSLFDDDAFWHLDDGAGGDGTQADAGKADGADAGKPAVPRLAEAEAAIVDALSRAEEGMQTKQTQQTQQTQQT